jgi:hypothetical protein
METKDNDFYKDELRKWLVIGFAFAIGILVLVAVAAGAPTTLPVTNITNGQVTFNAAGSGTDGWFEWGQFDGNYYHWNTLNQTYSGTFSDTQLGSPMLTNTVYYVRACDETGCGDAVGFYVPKSTLPNRTSYGTAMMQSIRSGFNMSYVIPAITAPYTDTMPGGAPVVWGMLFFFVFAGYWLRPRDIFLPMLLAMVAGGAIWLGNSALGVPPEFAHIGQGLFIAAMAGAFVSWFSK